MRLALATLMQRMRADKLDMFITSARADKAVGPAMTLEFFEAGLLAGKALTPSWEGVRTLLNIYDVSDCIY